MIQAVTNPWRRHWMTLGVFWPLNVSFSPASPKAESRPADTCCDQEFTEKLTRSECAENTSPTGIPGKIVRSVSRNPEITDENASS